MMVIRNMQPKDADAVIQMMRMFYASAAVLSNGSEEIFAADVENCVNENPYLEGYVFEDNCQICGYAMVAKSFSTEFGRPCVWVEDLYVKEAHRGTGIGTDFLKFIGKKYPKAITRLEAEHENERALKVYGKCGFVELPYIQMKRDSLDRT